MSRMGLTFKGKLFNVIEKMALRDETSKLEVVRNALAAYNYLCNEVSGGNKIVIVDESNHPVKRFIISNLE